MSEKPEAPAILDALADEAPEDLETLLEMLRHRGAEAVAKPYQIYCNRDLNFAEVDAVGFDMDYTLAVYDQEAIDRLSVDLTVERLIEHRGYPESLRSIEPRPEFAIRGLVIDRVRGNILKLDSHRHVGMAYHGFRELGPDELRTYRQEAIRFSGDRFWLIDTLYALPEAFLYAAVIDHLERADPDEALDYEEIFDDIRFCIDLAHSDGSFKAAIMADTPAFVERSKYLALTLHRFRSSGKKLFLLTNSYPAYTDHLMTYLLGEALAEYDSWRDYFDVIITAAHKPAFFTGANAFLTVEDDAYEAKDEADGFRRGALYQHGNLRDFVAWTGWAVECTLYVGDHIYGDILRSRKTSAWRTVMIAQEMETELGAWRELCDEIAHIHEIEDEIARLTEEISHEQWLAHNIEAIVERLDAGALDDAHDIERRAERELKRSRDRMKRKRRELLDDLLDAEHHLQGEFNAWWGLIFKMNNKNSLFGEQVTDYACLYTSRVANFVNYSPMHYFRAPRQPMPHEAV